ncbi:MAG: Ig-like domain-containing protein [Clostridia bacterium]
MFHQLRFVIISIILLSTVLVPFYRPVWAEEREVPRFEIAWSQDVGSKERETLGEHVAQTPDGGFVIVGKKGPGSFLAKLDAEGNVKWNRGYRYGNNLNFNNVIPTQDGGYLMIGETSNRSTSDMFMLKTDHKGTKQWHQIYSTQSNDPAHFAVQVKDGGYLVIGRKVLLKLDREGSIRWKSVHRYGEMLQAVETDEGYLLSGPGEQILVNHRGEILLKEGTADTSSFHVMTSDGGYIFLTNDRAVKIGTQGERQWEQSLALEENDEIKKMISTSDGGFAITIRDEYFGPKLYKYDRSGNKVGTTMSCKCEEYLDFEEIRAMIETADGGFAYVSYVQGDYPKPLPRLYKTVPFLVQDSANKLSLSKLTMQMPPKKTATIQASFIQKDGSKVDVTKDAQWASSNRSIVSVSKGTITSKGIGRAKVTVTYKGSQADMWVEVTKKPLLSSVTISPDHLYFSNKTGIEWLKATAHYTDGNEYEATSDVSWYSDDEKVAIVDRYGAVIVKGSGKTTIHAVNCGVEASIPVTVE